MPAASRSRVQSRASRHFLGQRQVLQPSPRHLDEAFHFPAVFLPQQHPFRGDRGAGLRRVDAPAVAQAGSRLVREQLGRAHSHAGFGQRGRVQPLIGCVQACFHVACERRVGEGHIRQGSGAWQAVGAVAHQTCAQDRRVERRPYVIARQDGDIARSNGPLSALDRRVPQDLDRIALVTSPAHAFDPVRHAVQLRAAAVHLPCGPSEQIRPRLECGDDLVEHQPNLAFISRCGPPALTLTNSLCPLPQPPVSSPHSLPTPVTLASTSGT